jgi:hypothetical protein
MRKQAIFEATLIAALATPLLLGGCLGDGGGGNGTTYDGNWTVDYTNPADIPVALTGQTVACTKPPVALTLSHGSGSATQILNCTITNTVVAGSAVQVTSAVQATNYLISVAINDVGVTNAIVNGSPLAGTCISLVGCSAQSGTKTLSLTR